MGTDYYKNRLIPKAPAATTTTTTAPVPDRSGRIGGLNQSRRRSTEPREVEYRFDRDTVVPVLYGRREITGIPIPVGVSGDKLYVCYIFCEGEIDSFESFKIDGQDVSNFAGLYSLTSYTGTLTQAYNADLHAADSNWVEPLTATAYVAAWFKADSKFNSIPKLSAVVKGLKVYDHRSGSTAYSSNPILCLVDNLRSSRYGGAAASSRIDWDSVDAAANSCDAVVGDEVRYSLHYPILNPTRLDQVHKRILDHCNGEQVFSEGKYHFYVHEARSSVASFTQDEVWDVNLSRPSRRQVFNRARASYVHQDDWREDEYTLETSELVSGSEASNEAHFDFTGAGSLSQVHRLCVYQLNKRASDLTLTFKTYNTKGLERYDRFQFTHDVFSLASQDFYAVEVGADYVKAVEYSPSLFSDTVIAAPTIPEADLPLPSDTPDDATGLTLTENVDQAKDTHFTSTIVASWTASVWPWVKHYEVWIKTSGSYVLYGVTTDTRMDIQVTEEEETYTVKVVTVSVWDVPAGGVEESIYIDGKNWPPEWPAGASLSGTEAGDVAILSWDAATDSDTVRYEIRRGRTTDIWETAAWVTTIDARSYFDRNAPAGTWRWFVKAIDSVGQYTDAALSVDIEVTINPNLAFNRDQSAELTGSMVTQVAVSPSGTSGDVAFPITSAAHTWADRFTAGNAWSAELTAGKPWIDPVPTSGTMELVTQKIDMGAQFTGEFSLDYTATKYGTGAATLTPYILLSDDDLTYTAHAASSTFTATARYLKVKFVWTCGDSSSFYTVSEPVTVTVKATPMIESGTATVTSSGSYSISFNMTFTSVDRVLLTPKGGTARIALADNVSTSGFDLKLFDTDGSAAAGDVYWRVEGV